MEYTWYNKSNKANAQTLRKNMTEQEKQLWYHFLQPLSVLVKRQKIIGNYIADFYIPSKKIVIELDGSQHFTEEGHDYDKERDEYMQSLGIIVLRYPNSAIDCSFESVCEDILKHLPTGTTFKET